MAESRTLVLVLGDQLDIESSAFDGFDGETDSVWMAEVEEESTHVPSSKPRIVLFLSAMRHFAHTLRAAGRTVHYTQLDSPNNQGSLWSQLCRDIERLRPSRLVMAAPGDWRVLKGLQEAAQQCGVPLEVREDRHFFVTAQEFRTHAKHRKSLRMEYFYREQRKRHRILMDPADPEAPVGGQWNFDAENRESFGREGPGRIPARSTFAPDDITREVISLVESRFAGHAGTLETFAWPVTRPQALKALEDFVRDRLSSFGRFQDALWPDEPWLFHAHLSAALNLKLLNPREVVAAAVAAYEAGTAPLASVEGFVRQVLGWREYVRGIYWTQMPGYLERNDLNAQADLPDWYWTGQTDMACLRDALRQTLTHGYAHHIQRLMVTGLYALMLGVHPRQVHAWYLAVYVDAVEWVELPNTLGMSQFADGGLMSSKPYVATGKYIERMSPHCRSCPYDPALRTGPRACPLTTLYWDFLLKHETLLARNARMSLQVKNLARLDAAEREAVAAQAARIRLRDAGARTSD